MFPNHFYAIHNSSSPWSRLQDKLFEHALVIFADDSPDRWENIAGQVPGKSASEVRQRYEDLVHDVFEIDSGRVELPSYRDSSEEEASWGPESQASQISFGTKPSRTDSERKKGVPWTEEEHRLFLMGLQKYGKGDWRSISRNAVVSRTPTQVASHAQKYYLRLKSLNKERKRSSIHDITTVESDSMPQFDDQTHAGSLGGLVHSTSGPMGPPKGFDHRASSSSHHRFGFHV